LPVGKLAEISSIFFLGFFITHLAIFLKAEASLLRWEAKAATLILFSEKIFVFPKRLPIKRKNINAANAITNPSWILDSRKQQNPPMSRQTYLDIISVIQIA
jgi:hypothetical protein